MKMVQCAGCERPIRDRFLLNVLDRSWHAKCVQCCDCKCNLTEKCFSRDGKLYCRTDFFKRFGTKCAGCCQGISPTDLVRRARNKVFHLKCFTCMVCRKQLSTGEELYVLDENRFICKDDYLSSKYSQIRSVHSPPDPMEYDENGDSQHDPEATRLAQDIDRDSGVEIDRDLHGGAVLGDGINSPGSVLPGGSSLGALSGSSPNSATPNSTGSSVNGTESATPTQNQNGQPANDENAPGTKRRGPRTTIKAKQLETLKAAFAATPKPTRHIREQLAQETGLNMRVIQVWFQNRRSKERRMKQLSTLGARRHFFRSPRRAMRPLRPGMSPDGLDDSPEMVGGPNSGFAYFSGRYSSNPGDFGYGPQGGFYDFFPGQQPPPVPGPEGLGYPGAMGSGQNPPPGGGMDQSVPQGPQVGPGPVNLGADAPYLQPHGDLMSQRSSPESVLSLPPVSDPYGPPRSTADGAFHSTLSHAAMSETPVW